MHANDATTLLEWYRTGVRPALEQVASTRLAAIDAKVRLVERLLHARAAEVPVCVLGPSGVGKSTLINALVGGRLLLLPQGGIGPLTAEAVVLRSAPDPYFRARYRPLSDILSELADLAAVLTDRGPADLVPRNFAARRARLLIEGDQFGITDPDYLRGIVSFLAGQSLAPPFVRPADEARLLRLRQVLHEASRNADCVIQAGIDLPGFLSALQEHAAGFLSPLVASLEVGWDADVLRDGVVLVDLPGVGVAHDAFQSSTRRWIEQARAVLLVVDRSGLGDASISMLRQAGLLARMLAGESSEIDGVNLFSMLVAVVKLDLSADDWRVSARILRRDVRRPWVDFFQDACREAATLLRGQLGLALEQECTRRNIASPSAAAAAALRRVAVFPVSAREHRQLLSRASWSATDSAVEDAPRITRVEESGIPALGHALRYLPRHHEGEIARILLAAAGELRTLVGHEMCGDAAAAATAVEWCRRLEVLIRGSGAT